MAFRKLQQKVPEFNAWTLANALQNTDGSLTPQQGADLLGARMIGRWKSGAPIDLAPFTDDPSLVSDLNKINNFDFSHPDMQIDRDQTKCPFSAHIRKTNPRADFNVPDNSAIRAGIPYGPEVSSSEASSGTSSTDRGLAFGASLGH